MNINDKENILHFHDVLTQEICRHTLKTYPTVNISYPNTQNNKNIDWKCCPRPTPLVYNDSTHDLPGFGQTFCK